MAKQWQYFTFKGTDEDHRHFIVLDDRFDEKQANEAMTIQIKDGMLMLKAKGLFSFWIKPKVVIQASEALLPSEADKLGQVLRDQLRAQWVKSKLED